MNVDLAVKGLAVFTAIPVVALAIWADWFGRALDAQATEDPLYEREPEVAKVRMAGVCALIAQFMVFGAVTELRAEAPVIGWIAVFGAVFWQGRILAKLEKRAGRTTHPGLKGGDRNINARAPGSSDGAPQDDLAQGALDMRMAMRGFVWATIGGMLYLFSFAFPVIVASMIAKAAAMPENLAGAFILCAALVGMLGGLAINFALTPFFLHNTLPTQAIDEANHPELKAMLESCFAQNGLKTPTLWIIESPRVREATAMIAGFSNGSGILRPGLFLSRGIVESLNSEQLRAVILHEVAHLKLNHLRRRLLYSAALIFGTTTAATALVYATSILMPASEIRNYIGFGAAAAAFVATFRLLGRQSRSHETEADSHSVSALGASHQALTSALRRLDEVNDLADPLRANPMAALGGGTHPRTDRRVEALDQKFGGDSFAVVLKQAESKASQGQNKDENESDRGDRAA
jgi:Zn-dependent protease with chaperone function